MLYDVKFARKHKHPLTCFRLVWLQKTPPLGLVNFGGASVNEKLGSVSVWRRCRAVFLPSLNTEYHYAFSEGNLKN